MRVRPAKSIMHGNELVPRIEHLIKIRHYTKRSERAVDRRQEAARDFDTLSVAPLPSADEIGEQQPVAKKLGMSFGAEPRTGLQRQNSQPVALAKHGVDASLNPDRCGVSLQFKLGMLQQVRVA